MLNLDEYKLGGINKEVVQLETASENRHCAAALVRQSRRSIEVASRMLDPVIYDQVRFTSAVKSLVTNNRRAQVRLLVWEPDLIVKRGHRLLQLVGSLSSYIEIRRAGQEHKDFNAGLLIVDSIGYMHRKNAERYESQTCFNDKRTATNYQNEFNDMWEVAKPDPNFRRLLI